MHHIGQRYERIRTRPVPKFGLDFHTFSMLPIGPWNQHNIYIDIEGLYFLLKHVGIQFVKTMARPDDKNFPKQLDLPSNYHAMHLPENHDLEWWRSTFRLDNVSSRLKANGEYVGERRFAGLIKTDGLKASVLCVKPRLPNETNEFGYTFQGEVCYIVLMNTILNHLLITNHNGSI
jgi:hypothetical protein